MNWYINQQVICIHGHGNGALKEGCIYTIHSICECPKCNELSFGVGIENGMGTYCSLCYVDISDSLVFSERRFAPLADISELEELLKEQKQTI